MTGTSGTLPVTGKRGFSMIELIVVLGIAAVLLGIATPRLLGTSSQVGIANARAEVSSAVSLARASASRYGRMSYLVLDVVSDRLEIRVDTSTFGGEPPQLLHSVSLWDEMGVNLRASYPLICFDPRGLSIPSGTCPGTGVVVHLERGPVQDSVVVSSTGRVSR